MADAVEVFVMSDPKPGQRPKGDWIVKVGRGRGGKIVSRHRLKSAAIKRGAREGRKRKDRSGGAVLQIRNKDGTIEEQRNYGDADRRRKGFFGNLFG